MDLNQQAEPSGPVEARYLSFLETISSLRPSLHRYCARMTGSVMDGEDVVQEALFEAYRKLDKFDEGRPLKPWLFRIAHNRCIDFLRRKGVRDEAAAVAGVREVALPTDAPLLGIGKAIEHLVAVLPSASKRTRLDSPERCVRLPPRGDCGLDGFDRRWRQGSLESGPNKTGGCLPSTEIGATRQSGVEATHATLRR